MTSKKCVIIDYGIGNIYSVREALKRNGVSPIVASDPNVIRKADRLILPGVGAFGKAISRIRERHLDIAIKDFVHTGKPFLGICVGMQLLLSNGSEFGYHKGLGYIEGSVDKIVFKDTNEKVRVPIIGWQNIIASDKYIWDNSLLHKIPEKNSFYFVHGYSAKVSNAKNIVSFYKVKGQKITAAIQKDNVFGVQFHPERSSRFGSMLLENFILS